MKRDFLFPRFCVLILLPATCLMITRCADSPKVVMPVIPPPHPVHYAGAAADPSWISEQTAAYKKKGVPDSLTDLTARMDFERQKTGEDPFVPQLTGTPLPQKTKKGAKKGTDSFFTPPDLPPPPTATPAPPPTPVPTPAAVQQTIPLAPAVQQDDSTPTIPPFPTFPPMPSIPPPPSQ